MSKLPKEIEEKIRQVEERAKDDTARSTERLEALDELTRRVEVGELEAHEGFEEDTSVVRHVEDLRRTSERVRRESPPGIGAGLRRVAQAFVTLPRARTRS
jgi:hypothetical protein